MMDKEISSRRAILIPLFLTALCIVSVGSVVLPMFLIPADAGRPEMIAATGLFFAIFWPILIGIEHSLLPTTIERSQLTVVALLCVSGLIVPLFINHRIAHFVSCAALAVWLCIGYYLTWMTFRCPTSWGIVTLGRPIKASIRSEFNRSEVVKPKDKKPRPLILWELHSGRRMGL